MLSQNKVAARLQEDDTEPPNIDDAARQPRRPGQQLELSNLPGSDWAGWQDVGQPLGQPAALIEGATRRALLSRARCCAFRLLKFCELMLTVGNSIPQLMPSALDPASGIVYYNHDVNQCCTQVPV